MFTFIAHVGIRIDQPAVKNLMFYYLQDPHSALIASLFLIYQPPLLDILPLYILFMLASPWVLAWAMRRGWSGVLWCSFALWGLAQFGLSVQLYELFSGWTGVTVPVNQTGSFVPMAWQLIWVAGLWLGSGRNAPDAQPAVFSRWTLVLANGLALAGLVWRHVEGQAAFGANTALNLLFDKWTLGPLRLLDLIALCMVMMAFGPWLAERIPRQRWLETLGAASLPVFCAHLVVVLLALTFFGSDPPDNPWWHDALLLAACSAVLYGVALISRWLDAKNSRSVAGEFASARSPLNEVTSTAKRL